MVMNTMEAFAANGMRQVLISAINAWAQPGGESSGFGQADKK